MEDTTHEGYDVKKITVSDGYQITARVYGNLEDGKPLLLIAGATAVPQRYYRQFSLHMQSKGFNIVTFDYRGIAESKYGPLKGFKADILDWAKKDLAGMLKWVLQYQKPYVVGHSLGGHAFGQLPDANDTLGLCTFGSGAGWHGHMPAPEMVKVWVLWNVLGPVLSTIYGYLPTKMVGIGENLPMGVYKQWRHWCRYPNYWFGDPKVGFADSFSRVSVPICSVNSIDDKWAPLKSVKAFMQYYSGADLQYIEINPKEYGLKHIGHMGYFHASCLDVTAGLITKAYPLPFPA